MSFHRPFSLRASQTLRCRARPAPDLGFSLIELLICLVIGGLMVTALFRSISAQGQLSDLQSAREEVQQNSRASLELIASELRAISASGAIVRAGRDSLTFRTTRLWGVVCGTSEGTLELMVSEVDARHFSITSGSGLVVNLGTSAEPEWTDAVDVVSVSSAAGPCGDAAGEVVPRLIVQLSALPVSGADLPQPGDLAGLFDQVTYRSGPSSGLRGRWIQRRSGDGHGSTNQPLAGPIRGAGVGLRFRYFRAGGAAVPSPVSTAILRDSIARIEVVVDATSLDRAGNVRAARRDSVTIPLRNRR